MPTSCFKPPAFALAMNMPGPNSDSYAAATLFICMFTTVVCGGFTYQILIYFGMQKNVDAVEDTNNEEDDSFGIDGLIVVESPLARRVGESIQTSSRTWWRTLDDNYMKELFGGAQITRLSHGGNYELSNQDDVDMEDMN